MTRSLLLLGGLGCGCSCDAHLAAQSLGKIAPNGHRHRGQPARPGGGERQRPARERRLPQDPFEQFFTPRGAEQVVEGYGSGFVISADGVVITNQHVTQGAEQIVVTTRDGRDFPAKILGEDPLTDIAVLKLDATGLPTAPLGKSTDLMIGSGSWRWATPSPTCSGNTEPTVTAEW